MTWPGKSATRLQRRERELGENQLILKDPKKILTASKVWVGEGIQLTVEYDIKIKSK